MIYHLKGECLPKGKLHPALVIRRADKDIVHFCVLCPRGCSYKDGTMQKIKYAGQIVQLMKLQCYLLALSG